MARALHGSGLKKKEIAALEQERIDTKMAGRPKLTEAQKEEARKKREADKAAGKENTEPVEAEEFADEDQLAPPSHGEVHPDPNMGGPEPELVAHNYTFVKTYESDMWIVTAKRDDGEERAEVFETEKEADDFLVNAAEEVRRAKIKVEEARLTALHTPIALTPELQDASKVLSCDDIVIQARDGQTLHLIPELVQPVKAWLSSGDSSGLGSDELNLATFCHTVKGLILVSYPDARKATFFLSGDKVIVSRS